LDKNYTERFIEVS